jgi:phosphate starvation-inducible PhoH-like protein/PhoH-like ATPase
LVNRVATLYKYDEDYQDHDDLITYNPKKDRRRSKKTLTGGALVPKPIQPITENQKLTFEQYYQDSNLLLHGVAGTGKTFISLYLALNEVIINREKSNVIIVRSVVPTRDMGFLPGNEKEKTKVYEQPYQAICTELFGRSDSYEILKAKKTIKFISTSFIRGITLNNSIVIVDECQNMTFHELDSVITRIGENSKIVFCGDFKQTDLIKSDDKNGVKTFMSLLDKLSSFRHVEFKEEDIVRSGLVKEYIIAKDKMGLT